MALSYYVLLYESWPGILLVSIIFITFGEMLAFPFSNSFAMERAPRGHEGRYMALYTMSFSLAHIMSSKVGMETISNFGYRTNWVLMGTLGLAASGACLLLMRPSTK